MEKFTVSHSPHISRGENSFGIMLDVIIALLPATVAGCIIFGRHAFFNVAVCVITAVAAEYLCRKIMKRDNTVGDLSAVVTGLLLGLNLPPECPVWVSAIGSVIAIVVVKQLFGGLGHNFANPAITARIALLVSFPTYMSTWTAPKGNSGELLTSATPLSSVALEKGLYSYKELFFGQVPGCIGETFSLLLIIGGLYLVIRKVIKPTIPLAYIGTVAVMSLIFGQDPLYMVLSGGLLLGAIFMATDYVTSPTYTLGQLVFGIGCGLICFVIRYFGNLPEGVSYSILIMNLLVPYINKLTAPKPFGWEAAKDEK